MVKGKWLHLVIRGTVDMITVLGNKVSRNQGALNTRICGKGGDMLADV